MSQQRYTVHLQGPFTTITEAPDGPWPRWHMARAAAIEHLREVVAGCRETLACLRRSASFGDYILLVGEMEGWEADQQSCAGQ